LAAATVKTASGEIINSRQRKTLPTRRGPDFENPGLKRRAGNISD